VSSSSAIYFNIFPSFEGEGKIKNKLTLRRSKMEVKWLGHAAFLIKGEGLRIVTDPYRSGAYDGISYGPIEEEVDVVTISHDHDDHNWTGDLKGKPIIVKGPGLHEAKGKTFKGIATFHDPHGGSQRGPNTVFCFELEGIKVCHLGDLGHVLEEKQVKEIGEVDLLLLPVGGFYTIDPREATQVMEQLKPKKVIPMHFKTPKCGFPIAEVEAFLKGKSNVRRLDSSSVNFVKEDFKEGETEIVVLKPAL
jgi:L-ascorbate metabolism protein UlaG (beta-lactamase superfamily)